MTHFQDYPQTVKLVNGLNSVSTLKKWRLKIERLTGHAFEESRVRTGKRSYSKVTLFTDSDIEQLQQVAHLKGSLGLEKAILKVYPLTRASPVPLTKQVQGLSVQVSQLNNQVERLTRDNQVLTLRQTALEKRIEVLEHPKKRTLFGK